jgi:hypothetical protein
VQEIAQPDGGLRFVLKEGTEIHQIAPPALICDLDTGRPCGRIGRDWKILPLSQPTVNEEPRDATIEAASAQTGKTEVAANKEDEEFKVSDL